MLSLCRKLKQRMHTLQKWKINSVHSTYFVWESIAMAWEKPKPLKFAPKVSHLDEQGGRACLCILSCNMQRSLQWHLHYKNSQRYFAWFALSVNSSLKSKICHKRILQTSWENPPSKILLLSLAILSLIFLQLRQCYAVAFFYQWKTKCSEGRDVWPLSLHRGLSGLQ